MKIMQVCSAETIGGGERHVIDLVRSLTARGHQLHLALRPGSPLRRALAGCPVTFHQLPLRNSLDLISAWRLSHLIRRESIDLIHAHVGRDYIVCGLAARLNPTVRFLLTRHHFNPFRLSGVGALYHWALARVDTMIAVSATVRDRLVTAFPALAARVKVVPNWHHWPGSPGSPGSEVEPRIDQPADTSREEARRRLGVSRACVIGIIGQISPLKGQDILVEAALSLLGTPAGCGLEFLVIGDPAPADRRYAQSLADRVAAAGCRDQIRFPGYIEDLNQVLEAFDIVTVLSVNEAFSLVLVDAMAAGVPVVATRVGGPAEIIRNEETGLFTDRDPDSLVATLNRLITDQPLRQYLAANARADVHARFDREVLIGRIEALMTSPRGAESLPLPRKPSHD